MARFLLKTLCATLLAALLATALALAAYPRHAGTRLGAEVVRAIDICLKPHPGSRALVLGDSVANQFFQPSRYQAGNPQATYATCNQAITPMGNRILLGHFLAANPQVRDVYYILAPASLSNDGGRRFTFHYFLYPFAEAGLFDDAPADIVAHLERRFGRPVLRNASLRHLLYRNDRLYEFYENHLVRIPQGEKASVPAMNAAQLVAMQGLCESAGAAFHLVAAPVSEANRSLPDTFRFPGEVLENVPSARDYLAELSFYPETDFVDGAHFTREFLAAHRDEIARSLLAGMPAGTAGSAGTGDDDAVPAGKEGGK